MLALVAPRAQLRGLGALAIAALHAGLWLTGHTGLQFAHLLLVASPLLWWSACATDERPAPAWTAASVIAVLALALMLTARFGVVLRVAGSRSGSEAIGGGATKFSIADRSVCRAFWQEAMAGGGRQLPGALRARSRSIITGRRPMFELRHRSGWGDEA